MKVVVCVLLCLVGAALSIPVRQDVSTRNNWVEVIFLDLLEELRETMLNGSDDVPVLDPLIVENVHLELEEFGLDDSHITLDDFKLDNLATFEIDFFQINIGVIPPQWRMSFDGKIPNLDVEVGHYNTDLSVMGYRFWGDGSAKLSIIEPRIEGRVGIRLRLIGGFYLSIDSSDITFYLKELKSNITGMLGDEAASDFLNSVIEILIPDLVEAYRVEISEVINAVVIKVGNEILADLDLSDIFR